MKKTLSNFLSLALVLTSTALFAQQPAIQYFRANDKTGLNVFEPSKVDSVPYDNFKLRLGGAFAIQFQAIDHEMMLITW